MPAYLTKRLLWAVLVLLGLSLVCFTLLSLVPGDPARIVGMYSSSWMRPSKVRLLIMSSATSG